MFVFPKIWRDLFSCYLCFEIRPFTLLQKIYIYSFVNALTVTEKIRKTNSLPSAWSPISNF